MVMVFFGVKLYPVLFWKSLSDADPEFVQGGGGWGDKQGVSEILHVGSRYKKRQTNIVI